MEGRHKDEGIELARVARAASEELGRILGKSKANVVPVTVNGHALRVPRPALTQLAAILEAQRWGLETAVLPASTEIGTQAAADLLNVSRPYFVKLLDEGMIPYRKVGNRRRVLARDVLSWRQADDERRRSAFEQAIGR